MSLYLVCYDIKTDRHKAEQLRMQSMSLVGNEKEKLLKEAIELETKDNLTNTDIETAFLNFFQDKKEEAVYIADSCYAVDTIMTFEEVFQYFAKYLKPARGHEFEGDKLFVVAMAHPRKGILDEPATNWLAKHFPQPAK